MNTHSVQDADRLGAPRRGLSQNSQWSPPKK